MDGRFLCFERARAAWPGVEVGFDEFAARLDHERGGDHAADLYLACACSAGHPVALIEFDRRLVACVRAAVLRIDPSYDFLAEVQQVLRERLLVGPGAKIRDYHGTGTLTSWIRTSALRTALNLKRSANQQAHRAHEMEPLEPLLDPSIAMLRQKHAPDIDRALRAALDALDPDERLLLRFYYVDGLTLARIAALERIGTTTVFRRLNAASGKVLRRVRQELSEQLDLGTQSLDSLIRHVRGDAHLSFDRLLQAGGRAAADQ